MAARLPSLPAPAGALLTLGLVACGNQGLSQSWQLDRMRVLAVKVEPAEPRPGDSVSFEALYYLPDGAVLQLGLWFACIPESGAVAGCTVDQETLDRLATLDPESLSKEELAKLFAELQAAGLVGAEPLLAPRWTVPADALDALSDEEKLEGLTAMVNVTAMPEGAGTDGDVELAYKRFPVSLAATPNHNPGLTGFVVDETALAPDSPLQTSEGQALTITPVLAKDAIETYTFRTDEGLDEERVEEPYITWYAEGGEFDQPYSLYPTLDVVWTAPSASVASALSDGTVTLLAVLRDRRGGMGWAAIEVQVDPAASMGRGDEAGR